MSMTLAYEHLDCSNPERPLIAGKKFKVIHLMREHLPYGWGAEELALNHPQSTLGEVYAALAYYADHRERLDGEIATTEKEAIKMQAEPRHRTISARLKR
jgi:uncharacterized protein (DUF433 family)